MSEYLPVGLMLLFGGVVVGVMVLLNRLLGPRRHHSAVTAEPFECGNPVSGSAWHRFSIKFYLVAILFIVFDIEVVFMYPWAVVFRELGLFGFIEMMIFVVILTVGFVFAWRKGALGWN